jgi:hypothetical protein
MSDQQAPPRYIVMPDGEESVGFFDAESAKAFGQERAAAQPGRLVHFYQHMMSTSARPPATQEQDDGA